MIRKLIAASGKNPLLVAMVVVLATAAGIWSLLNTPLDAIPDLSDVEVIVYTPWQGRSPNLIEDQVTYPIVTSLLGAPHVKSVRGVSDFGYSYVYVVFDEGTDLYWARSRILEYLSKIGGKLPSGVRPILGPDATGVGWVYEYALVDTTGRHSLADLRTLQDWYLRFALQSLPGVAEVASVGGFQKQYQINIDPDRLLSYNISPSQVLERVRESNNDVGGRSLEKSEREYVIRGRGYIHTLQDIERIPVGIGPGGVPVLVRNIATVEYGSEMRRGAVDLDGKGETVGGVVIMRYRENALEVIDRVKKKIAELGPSLPEGVRIVPVYDRSGLILKSVATLQKKLLEVIASVILINMIFLIHFRSSLVAILSLPVAILLAFFGMKAIHLSSNIMSLGGIIIAIGTMVDAAIVMVENAHRKLENIKPGEDRILTILEAAQEVGRPLFFSLLVIASAYIPIFSLQGQEGRLFRPLAFTNVFSLLFAVLLSVTFVPALMVWLIRGKIRPASGNPLNRGLISIYSPILRRFLAHPKIVLASAGGLIFLSVPVYARLGSEFMPPLYEGTILFMPSTLPGISITQAVAILKRQDAILARFPEVEHVFGKVGRTDSPTDSAPISMTETVISLKPRNRWPEGESYDRLVSRMNDAVRFPGVTNVWGMPIQIRTEMLATGIRSAVGIKIFGSDLHVIDRIGKQIEQVLPGVRGTRSAYSERLEGGYFIDFVIDREKAERYDLTVRDIEDVVQSAIGGKNVTTTVEGRERYTVNARYGRDFRNGLSKLEQILVPTPAGPPIPLAQLTRISVTKGAPMVRDENGSLSGIVSVDVAGRDLVGWVEEAKRTVREHVSIPEGYRIQWAGSYEYFKRARQRIAAMVPLTILIVFFLLYLNFRSATESFIVLLSFPLGMTGGLLYLWILHYNVSVAVWVGILALGGISAETGVVMLVYLDEACNRKGSLGQLKDERDLEEAIVEGAAKRVRPKIMTVSSILFGLIPVMWSHGTGADVMKRIAAPMVGGLITSTLSTLVVVPVLYALWKKRSLPLSPFSEREERS